MVAPCVLSVAFLPGAIPQIFQKHTPKSKHVNIRRRQRDRPLPQACEQTKNARLSSNALLLSGRTSVVTGGHRGIGEAITRALARAGSDIIVIDRQGPGSNSTIARDINAYGRRHASIEADLGNVTELMQGVRAAKETAKGWKRHIDILVNNAGVALVAPAAELSLEAWDNTMAINLRAPFLLGRELATGPDGMLQAGGGSIVNISSTAGRRALAEHTAYSASKAGLEMMTKTMAVEWAAQGVRANVIAPTVVFTDMGKKIWDGTDCGKEMIKRVPRGRFAQPHEVADAVVFLCSEAAGMINGAVIPVDGGFLAS